MAKYLVIAGNEIVSTIDTVATNVIALPLFGGGDSMSLVNTEHLKLIQSNLTVRPRQAIEAMGFASDDLTELYKTKPDPSDDDIWDAIESHTLTPAQL